MSFSQRTRRTAQRHLHRSEDVELNLIPMIDIMSVMVAFLLIYSADVEVVQNAKDVKIPQSVAPEEAKQSVIVVLTPRDLFVQGERVASVAEIRDAEDGQIGALSAVLARPTLETETTPEALASREVTLIADKSLPYEVVKRVMSTCTREGYGHISLAVIEKESAQI